MRVKRHIIWLMFVIFGIIIQVAPAWANFAVPEKRVNTGLAAGIETASDHQILSLSDGHVFAVWFDDRNGSGDIYFNSSSDYGVTWNGSDTRVDTGDAPGSTSSYNPQVCAIPDGHVYVSWGDSRLEIGDIFFNVSTDFGQTWEVSPKVVYTGPTNEGSHEISCHGSYVYITYRSDRSGEDDIYFNVSSDYGTTWLPSDIRLDVDNLPGSTSSYSPKICSTSDGHVYVLWAENDDGAFNHTYMNVSSDYGSNWRVSTIRMDTSGIGTGLWPDLSCEDDGHVYAVWEDYRNGSRDIYFNYSTNYGLSFLGPLRIDLGDIAGSSHSSSPIIASLSNGYVYVIWLDERYGANDAILFNRSGDYGATWLADSVAMNPSPGTYNASGHSLAATGDKVFVAWHDQSDGSYSAWLRVLKGYGLTELPTLWNPVTSVDPTTVGSGAAMLSANNGRLYYLFRDNRDNASVYDLYHNVWKEGGAGLIPTVSDVGLIVLFGALAFILILYSRKYFNSTLPSKGAKT